jgi:hypothetical protein
MQKSIIDMNFEINTQKNESHIHYQPASEEWSSSIYSYNKKNVVLAPQIARWTGELSRHYFNALPKSKKMDSLYVVKQRSKKKFVKIFFPFNRSKLNSRHADSTSDISNLLLKKRKYKTNKYLYLFNTRFKFNKNINRDILNYFYGNTSTNKNISSKNTDTSIVQTNKRYSVLKVYLNSPNVKYSTNNVSIIVRIYNKKNLFMLKKMQRDSDIVKTKFAHDFLKKNKVNSVKKNVKVLNTKSLIKLITYLRKNNKLHTLKSHLKNKPNLHKRSKKSFIKRFRKYKIRLRNKLIYKLNNKSSISFFYYMWKYAKSNPLQMLCKNTYLCKIWLKNLTTYLTKYYIFNLETSFSATSLFNKKKMMQLQNVLKKYSLLFESSKKTNVPNLSWTKNLSYLKKLCIIDINCLRKKFYGLKPLINLYYFKHHMLIYYFEYYKKNNSNMIALKNIFFKLFFKKIYYNIVNLKYWHLDSKIVADVITTKLIDRKKKVLKVLKKSLTSKPYFDYSSILQKSGNKDILTFTWVKDFLFSNFISKKMNVTRSKNICNNHILFIGNNYKTNLLLDNLQNKWKLGTTLQAKGRITKRKTAQRSLLKIRRMGSLQNILSSRAGISTSLSKGFAKSNLQYNNNNNYNANGSFGLRVYISSLQTLQKWNMQVA